MDDKTQPDLKQRVERLLKPFVLVLAHMNINPNFVSVFGLLASIVAFCFIIKGFIFWAGMMVIISGLSDMIDGQLARHTGRVNPFGALFDSTLDRYAEGLIFLGLTIHFWERSLFVVILIIIAVVGSLLVSYTKARAESLGVKKLGGLMQRKERLIILILGFIIGSIEYTGDIALGLAIGIIAVLSNFTVIQRLILSKRELNEIKQ